ncbi:MAG: TonB-dependent receptor, partial [Verrucomicrobia bacterium]|nr:TonB-dependent receptor [Verrucomicrobiota bacterium]
REMSGSSVAINERRTAANLRNVVAADEFGDSTEGNIGEFVKYIPAVAIDYTSAEARFISLRGMPSFGTAVMIDGNRMASAAASFSRASELDQVSLNNMSRIEVTKSPLPDSPADTIGGAVNMVLKSAFERAKPSLIYRADLNANFSRAQGENFVSLRKSPGPGAQATVKIKPGFDVNYINPVSKTFGFTVSLLNSNQYSPAALISPQWRPVTSGTGLAPADQPFLGTVLVSDRPREGYRWSAGLSLDWRVAPQDVLTFGVQWNRFETVLDTSDLQFNVIGASSVRPTSYDATTTAGAPNAGNATWALTTFHKFMLGHNVNVAYRHRGAVWSAAAGAAYSFSKTYVDSAEDGVIKTVNFRSPNIAVRYDGIRDSLPGRISATTAAGTPYAFADLGTYTLQSVTQGTPQHYRATTVSGYANATRPFQIAIPFKLKAGLDVRRERRETTNPTATLTFVGPDGTANTADDLAGRYDLVESGYSTLRMPFGVGPVQRPSSRKTYALAQANPGFFVRDEAAEIRSAATNSKEFSEIIGAGYLRADAAFFENRLKLAGGFRYEHTYDEGRGLLNDPSATYRKDAAGKLVLDAAGRPIKVAGSTADLTRLQYQERGSRGERDYGNLFPSLNATYGLTEKILLRSSFAQTVTRPQINSVVPSTTVTDPGTTAIPTITVNNPGLKPWFSNNYDVAIEYYFSQPGLISIGAFRKDIKDFFGAVRTRATSELLAEYGFDDSFLNYEIATQQNVGSAKVSGVELDYRQSLTGLPEWAKGLALFANATALRVQGASTADFSGFIGRSANWGVSLSRPRFTAKLNWNYRGRQRLGAVTGTNVPAGTYQFASPRLSTDVNLEYRLTKYATL